MLMNLYPNFFIEFPNVSSIQILLIYVLEEVIANYIFKFKTSFIICVMNPIILKSMEDHILMVISA
jgi:hypothetical protein